MKAERKIQTLMEIFFLTEGKITSYLIICFRNKINTTASMKCILTELRQKNDQQFSLFQNQSTFIVWNKRLWIIALCCPLLGTCLNCLVRNGVDFLEPVDKWYSGLAFRGYWICEVFNHIHYWQCSEFWTLWKHQHLLNNEILQERW